MNGDVFAGLVMGAPWGGREAERLVGRDNKRQCGNLHITANYATDRRAAVRSTCIIQRYVTLLHTTPSHAVVRARNEAVEKVSS